MKTPRVREKIFFNRHLFRKTSLFHIIVERVGIIMEKD